MPQSFSAVYMHIIFSTKNRMPFLNDISLRTKTHIYLAGIANAHDCPALIVGGVADHVHLLVRFGRQSTQSDLVRELKRASSIWLKQQGLQRFQWQSGYGFFGVSFTHLSAVKSYIAEQEEHHRHISFQEEYRNLMRKNGEQWDENFVWE